MPELRWNPLLGEWGATAAHRDARALLPASDACPLCPTQPGGVETEIPFPDFDIAVFENRFPALRSPPLTPSVTGSDLYPVRAASGACEVVVYSSRHDSSLAQEPVEQIYKLVRVWADRFRELEKRPDVRYVGIFENRGAQVGATLSHPHGQIYAYPVVPAGIAREVDQARLHKHRTGRCLGCDIVREEMVDGRRIVAKNDSFVAYVPFFARWPYEVHISPRGHVQALTDLGDAACGDLAALLRGVVCAYDRVFDAPFPYVMSIHQRPSDKEDHSAFHFHVELCPPLRGPERIKHLAGGELGAGFFVNDSLPEDRAAELRQRYRSLSA